MARVKMLPWQPGSFNTRRDETKGPLGCANTVSRRRRRVRNDQASRKD